MAKKKDSSYGYNQLKADLKKGAFRRMYIFYGEERYLLEYYRSELRKKMTSGPSADFNFYRFTEENWDIAAFSDALDTIPMMGQNSLIEFSDINLFSRPESERQTLTEIFNTLPDYCTVLYLSEEAEWKPDRRKKKLCAAIESAALLVEFQKQPESQLVPWIQRHLAAEQKTMSNDLCRYLISQTGGSMTVLSAELQKLVRYTDQSVITRADIDAIVIPVTEAAVFDMTRDISLHRYDQALSRLHTLFQQDSEAIAVNAAIGWQMRRLYAAKVLSDHGQGANTLADLYGLWPSQAREIYSQASGFRRETLQDVMLLSAKTDQALKSTSEDESRLVELVVLRLAEKCR